MQAMLNILNNTRAQHGVAPLTLNMTESNGTGTCVGSYGHSVHMQKMGTISHDQFPADICIPAMLEAENVGMWQGDELQALQSIHNMMMGEPYTPGCMGTHVCNILSSKFRQVGIGIYYVNNTVWLTEDFLG
jgi:hypothetical protein